MSIIFQPKPSKRSYDWICTFINTTNIYQGKSPAWRWRGRACSWWRWCSAGRWCTLSPRALFLPTLRQECWTISDDFSSGMAGKPKPSVPNMLIDLRGQTVPTELYFYVLFPWARCFFTCNREITLKNTWKLLNILRMRFCLAKQLFLYKS